MYNINHNIILYHNIERNPNTNMEYDFQNAIFSLRIHFKKHFLNIHFIISIYKSELRILYILYYNISPYQFISFQVNNIYHMLNHYEY
jgi:hypothetical protein